jgi:hypothetical protein
LALYRNGSDYTETLFPGRVSEDFKIQYSFLKKIPFSLKRFILNSGDSAIQNSTSHCGTHHLRLQGLAIISELATSKEKAESMDDFINNNLP